MAKPNKSSGVFNDLNKEMEKTTDDRFLRLEEDGEKVSVFFAGKPYARYVYWDGQQTREWTEGCGEKKDLRVAMNVIVCEVEDKQLEIQSVKVLEQGKRFFQNVSKRDEKDGIREWIFEIECSGSKGDTDTTYDIDGEYKLYNIVIIIYSIFLCLHHISAALRFRKTSFESRRLGSLASMIAFFPKSGEYRL